ncbi:alpha-mannosidase [Amnibacterium kyonggiense]
MDDVDPFARGRIELAERRVHRFLRERVEPAVHGERRTVEVRAWTVDGEPVPFAEAVAQRFEPFRVGERWGRPWDTVWFAVRGEVPEGWGRGEAELLVDLGFDAAQPGFQAEATAYRPDGSIVKAVEPRNAWVPLDGPGPFAVLLEAAANPVVFTPFHYDPTPVGDPATAGDEPIYRLTTLELARRDTEVWELLQDALVLDGLVAVLPEHGARRAQLVAALERMVDVMDPADVPGTAAAGRAALAPALAVRAADSALRVSAVGHAHIDSAWLWPTRETVRKVTRTFANVLDLIDRDPEFVYAASSAQQYAWLRAAQPALFERVRAAVAAGRIKPVGGMWVESDTNMPSGESLVRQLVHGKRWFLEHLGVESDELWLPDSFGYTAALPQIARAAGVRSFVTQKPSWNETNRMPSSTFLWEGIDGSRLLTHFPPADTYNSDLGAEDLARTERRFAEKGRAKEVLGLFGFGDGGGGPTREMLAAAHRKADLDGSPRVRLTDPATFFADAAAELPDPSVWSGEMYLELHRGTLISQQRTKRGNRHSEALLREAELWATAAAVLRDAAYPYDALEEAWRTVLLQQFHDILPGSSIAWVHQEAERNHARVADALEGLIADALAALGDGGAEPLVANAAPVARDGVPALGIGTGTAPVAATPRETPRGFALVDDALRAVVDRRGVLLSVQDRASGREVLPEGLPGGVLQLFRDTPRDWDAWDIDAEDQRDGVELLTPESVAASGDAVVVRHRFGASSIEIRIRVVDGRLDHAFDVDWHERQKLLKLAFPLDVRATAATSEIQFGHLQRPIHRNTSWDTARFETVAHRWIHVGETGFGVAIANDVVYGHDVRAAVAPSGRPMAVARLSLLRAPLFPDPTADQGRHRFTVSLRPGGIPEAIDDGYRQHLPRRTTVGSPVEPLVAVSDPAVVVEAVKLAEDRSGDVVVRLAESLGGRASGTLRTAFPWRSVAATDLLERVVASTALGRSAPGGSVPIALRPFELLTLRFSRG